MTHLHIAVMVIHVTSIYVSC